MKKQSKKVISIMLFTFVFSLLLIGNTRATGTSYVDNVEEFIQEATSSEVSKIILNSDITISDDVNILIDGNDKTLDLNGKTLTIESDKKILLNYNTSNTFTLEDSDGSGCIISEDTDETNRSIFVPINNTGVNDDIEMVVNSGCIKTNALWIFEDTNGFKLTINAGFFITNSSLFKFSTSYNSSVVLNNFVLRSYTYSEEENLRIAYYGKYSQNTLSTIMSSDSKLIYIKADGEFIEQSKNMLCGKSFKNSGKLYMLPKNGLEIDDITFETEEYGYSRIPQQSIVINNVSDKTIKVVDARLFNDEGEFSLGNSQVNYNGEINILSDRSDDSFRIRPVPGLTPGKYYDFFVVTTEDGNKYSTKVSFEVTKAHLNNLRINLQDWEYETKPNEPASSGNLGHGHETYEYAKKINGVSNENLNYSEEVPTEIGEYVVRLSVEETENYYSGSATKEFRITRRQIDPSINITDNTFVFSGAKLTPEITVTVSESKSQKTLEENVDYEIEYGENINAGQGTVTIKSLDTSVYTFEDKTENFTINPKELIAENVIVSEQVSYSVSGTYPNVVVTDGTQDLTKDIDYEVTYEGQNGDVEDIITVRVTGIGNYTGTIEKYSTISNKASQILSFSETHITKVYNDSKFIILPIHEEGDGDITFSSSNTNVAQVNSTTGEVTIVGVGNAIIIATASETQNYIPQDASYYLTVNKANYDMSRVTFNNLSLAYDKNSHSISATNLPEGVTAQYTNNNKTEPGVYEVVATFIGDYEHYNEIPNRKAILTINKANYNMSNLKFNNTTVTFDNKSHSIIANGIPEGVKVTYINNGKINIGTYKITANFVGDNTRYNSIPSKTATLTIKAKKLDNNTITFGIKDKTYTGKNITQVFTIIDGTNILKEGKDYTLKYSSNKKVGTATITITGKGNYTGTTKRKFKINPKSTSLKKLTAGKKQIKATWKAQKTETTGYEIEYSTNKKFRTGNKKTKIKKNKVTESTIKKLKAKKKYYVRIRTYKTVNGNKYYSEWSKVKTVTTKK